MKWRQVPCILQGAACRRRKCTETRRQGNCELLLPWPSILWQVNKARCPAKQLNNWLDKCHLIRYVSVHRRLGVLYTSTFCTYACAEKVADTFSTHYCQQLDVWLTWR